MTVESVADFWAETDIGREVLRRDYVRGLTMSIALRWKFGDGPGVQEAARQLAMWSDLDAALSAVYAAASLTDIPETEDADDTRRRLRDHLKAEKIGLRRL